MTKMIHVYQREHDIHKYNELLNENKITKSINTNGIHIGYKNIILAMLDYGITSKKILIKINTDRYKGKINFS